MPSSGPTVYSVEGAVWAACIAGWLAARLALSQSPLDLALLTPSVCIGFANLILCSVLSDNREPQSALFNVLLPLWLTYAYASLELISAPVSKSLFGDIIVPPVSAGVSLAFLCVQLLLSAAAIAPSIWTRKHYWMDVLAVFVTTLQAVLCNTEQNALPLTVCILISNTGILALLGVRMWDLDDRQTGSLYLCQIFEIVHCILVGFSFALALGVAYASRTTLWALVIYAVAILAGTCIRTAMWTPKPQADQQDPAAVNVDAPANATAAELVFGTQSMRLSHDTSIFSRSAGRGNKKGM